MNLGTRVEPAPIVIGIGGKNVQYFGRMTRKLKLATRERERRGGPGWGLRCVFFAIVTGVCDSIAGSD